MHNYSLDRLYIFLQKVYPNIIDPSQDMAQIVKVTTARSKVKSMSYHDVARLQCPNQCPYQVSTSYTLWCSEVKLRSHHDIAHMHPHSSVPKSIKFLHRMVSELQPGQTFSHHLCAQMPTHLDTMGENNTPTALKGCGVKMIILHNLDKLLKHLLSYSTNCIHC